MLGTFIRLFKRNMSNVSHLILEIVSLMVGSDLFSEEGKVYRFYAKIWISSRLIEATDFFMQH